MQEAHNLPHHRRPPAPRPHMCSRFTSICEFPRLRKKKQVRGEVAQVRVSLDFFPEYSSKPKDMRRTLVALCCVAAVDGFAPPARLPPPAIRARRAAHICTVLEMVAGAVNEPRLQVGTLSVSPMGMVCGF